jgi:hypothetical protein
MRSCQTAFFMWLPILIGKLLKGIWLFIKWILQTISGVPLHFCKPEYRIPGQIIGTIGLFFTFFFILGIFAILLDSSHLRGQSNPFFSILLSGIIGFGLLIICRILIKRGSV